MQTEIRPTEEGPVGIDSDRDRWSDEEIVGKVPEKRLN